MKKQENSFDVKSALSKPLTTDWQPISFKKHRNGDVTIKILKFFKDEIELLIPKRFRPVFDIFTIDSYKSIRTAVAVKSLRFDTFSSHKNPSVQIPVLHYWDEMQAFLMENEEKAWVKELISKCEKFSRVALVGGDSFDFFLQNDGSYETGQILRYADPGVGEVCYTPVLHTEKGGFVTVIGENTTIQYLPKNNLENEVVSWESMPEEWKDHVTSEMQKIWEKQDSWTEDLTRKLEKKAEREAIKAAREAEKEERFNALAEQLADIKDVPSLQDFRKKINSTSGLGNEYKSQLRNTLNNMADVFQSEEEKTFQAMPMETAADARKVINALKDSKNISRKFKRDLSKKAKSVIEEAKAAAKKAKSDAANKTEEEKPEEEKPKVKTSRRRKKAAEKTA
jgi:hypothetical protein